VLVASVFLTFKLAGDKLGWADVAVWALPQAPSVIDTPARNEASQPTDGKPSPHLVTDSEFVYFPA